MKKIAFLAFCILMILTILANGPLMIVRVQAYSGADIGVSREPPRFKSEDISYTIAPGPLTGKAGKIYIYTPNISPEPTEAIWSVKGPQGMEVSDPNTGYLTWIPTIDQIGEYHVMLEAEIEAVVYSVEWDITVHIIDIDNPPPEYANVESKYIYKPRLALKKDTWTIIRWDVDKYPTSDPNAEMIINKDTGVISWTPKASEIGTYQIILSVNIWDSNSKEWIIDNKLKELKWQLEVRPKITTAPPTYALIGMEYRYEPDFVGLGDFKWALSGQGQPEDINIEENTGVITWTPTVADIGEYYFFLHLIVNGITQTQPISITVNPRISTVPPKHATVGMEYSYSPIALGNEIVWDLQKRPAGMQMDPNNGYISWLPAIDQLGEYNIILMVASDGQAVQQDWIIEVRLISTTPPAIANIDTEYTYTPGFFAGANAFWSLLESPQGMTVDQSTGRIKWTPGKSQVGDYSISLRVEIAGKAELQDWTIAVDPIIISTPPNIASIGATYIYSPVVVGEGAALQWLLLESPEGMNYDPNTGAINWVPQSDQVGHHTITLSVEMNARVDIQEWVVHIKPVIQSIPPTSAEVGSEYYYIPDILGEGEKEWVLMAKPSGMFLDTNIGQIRWFPNPKQIGKNNVILKVIVNGETVTQDWIIDVGFTPSFKDDKGGCFISAIETKRPSYFHY